MTEEKKNTALNRVEDELIDLTEKTEALAKFKTGKAYAKLSKNMQRQLRIQLKCMLGYAEALTHRIKIW